MTEAEIIARLVHVWQRDIAPHVHINACILGARVASGVLDYYGITNKVLACGVFVINDEGAELLANDVPKDEWPPSAWSIGIDPSRRDGPGYSGHVIVRTASGVLIDLSARQFHRHGRINVDGPRVWEPADITTTALGQLIVHDGGVWFTFDPITDKTYRKSPDWNARATVGQVIKAMNNTTEGSLNNGNEKTSQ